MRARAPFLAVALLCLALAGLARAEIVQRGHLRVAFDAGLTPRALPRTGGVPVGVEVGGRITTTDGRTPPQLRTISIAVNRYGRISPGSLPVCRLEQIQPATTEGALEACGRSLVGHGSFSAKVLLPQQAPFPSEGKVYAFNGVIGCSPSERRLRSRRGDRAARCHSRPAILAHVYGTEPAPTSYTLPFQITATKGTFGTRLTASLPDVTSDWGYVTSLDLTLTRSSPGGRGSPYVSATCPAPEGFPGAVFPLARTTFVFKGGPTLSATLNRGCRVSG